MEKRRGIEKLKSELSALERKIQLTLIPKQGIQASEGAGQTVMEMKNVQIYRKASNQFVFVSNDKN